MSKKKVGPKKALRRAFRALDDAHNEAKRHGDVEALLNIGITYFEFALKVPGELHDEVEKAKHKIGFVGDKDD